jgi:hypothetical protein
MLKFMDFVNNELKRGKDKRARQDKMIKIFMMQHAWPFSSTKKLAKINMPIILLVFDKAKKFKESLLEMDNYYNVQRSEKNDKVSMPLTFLKNHALQ